MRRTRTGRREKTKQVPAKPVPVAAAAPPPRRWLMIAALALGAICLLGLFSNEAGDTDFWWHLKTGQFIVERHSLPVPDPFAYTTALNPPANSGEAQVRHFNLTHEWLAQALMYLVYLVGGFPLVILVRAGLLAGMCALAGLLAGKLSKNFYVGIAAAFAAASLAIEFRADRPALVTFFFVAVFVALLELRWGLWALPPLALLWANCHGGFFLGWIVLLAYCVETVPLGKWLNRATDARKLWLVTASTIAASFFNPNGFGVVSTLFTYRQSALTADLIEWRRPYLWGPPYAFDILLYTTALGLILSWRRVRPAHLVLSLAFAGAALAAFRNTPFIAFLGPVLIGGYLLPRLSVAISKVEPILRRGTPWAVPLVLSVAIGWGLSKGQFFELRAANWTVPGGAADFLLTNHITGRLFNTYGFGGYLIWKLWPQQQVFIDGRALSESLYKDYNEILSNQDSVVDQVTGPRAELLKRYAIDLVVTNVFEYNSGNASSIALALARPESPEWQLVYDDPQALVFRRQPGSIAQVDKLGRVLRHMDAECMAYIEHSPESSNCAKTLCDFWMRSQQQGRALRMLRLYLMNTPQRDPQAEQWWGQLGGGALPRR